LSYRNLTKAYLGGFDMHNAHVTGATLTNAYGNQTNLTDADLSQANLSDAFFAYATLTGADFSGADVRGASFYRHDYAGGTGITLPQLYSTASYQEHDLTGIRLVDNDLSGANFAGQNLTNASFRYATLTDADFTGADVRRASFGRDSNYRIGGISLAQLYSTASYQAHDLSGIGLDYNILYSANFAGQNLTDATFEGAHLTVADFAGADVRGANFNRLITLLSQDVYGSGITPAQLYSTSSYQAHDLSGTSFFLNDLSVGNFAGQNVTNASFVGATLTDADFTGAEIRGASFGRFLNFFVFPNLVFGSGITLTQLYSTASYQAHDLSGTSFWKNDLSGGNFVGQNLTVADFGRANLTGADFRKANLTNAHFGSATLTAADFKGAEVRGANLQSTGITLAQLYSTASYQAHDLSGIGLAGNDLTGANFTGQKLTNAGFSNANLTDADFSSANLTNAFLYATNLTGADLTAADTRGALDLNLPSSATSTNQIRPDGHIGGLDLDDRLLVLRYYDGRPEYGTIYPPIPITIDQHLMMGPGGTLRMVFEADAWDSTISFAPGIPVTLGGTLELTFADDVNLASQFGRTFDLFDWTGVNPTGAFAIASPYAWDLSNLYTTGDVTLTAVPEPTSLATFLLCALLITCSATRARSGLNSENSWNLWKSLQYLESSCSIFRGISRETLFRVIRCRSRILISIQTPRFEFLFGDRANVDLHLQTIED
jgi:uncharacterized protein YjbI with pentapeptide repeats